MRSDRLHVPQDRCGPGTADRVDGGIEPMFERRDDAHTVDGNRHGLSDKASQETGFDHHGIVRYSSLGTMQ